MSPRVSTRSVLWIFGYLFVERLAYADRCQHPMKFDVFHGRLRVVHYGHQRDALVASVLQVFDGVGQALLQPAQGLFQSWSERELLCIWCAVFNNDVILNNSENYYLNWNFKVIIGLWWLIDPVYYEKKATVSKFPTMTASISGILKLSFARKLKIFSF